MQNIFQIERDTCLVCRKYWCTCMQTWSVKKIESATTEYLQTVLVDCFECGVQEEDNIIVMAITMELVHRIRYNLNPAKRFTGETQ